MGKNYPFASRTPSETRSKQASQPRKKPNRTKPIASEHKKCNLRKRMRMFNRLFLAVAPPFPFSGIRESTKKLFFEICIYICTLRNLTIRDAHDIALCNMHSHCTHTHSTAHSYATSEERQWLRPNVYLRGKTNIKLQRILKLKGNVWKSQRPFDSSGCAVCVQCALCTLTEPYYSFVL